MTNQNQPLERRATGRRRVAAITLAAALGATAGTAALTHELVPGSASTTTTTATSTTTSSTTTGTTATNAQAPSTSSGSGVTTSGGS